MLIKKIKVVLRYIMSNGDEGMSVLGGVVRKGPTRK